MKIRLDYFKPWSGKWYTWTTYESNKEYGFEVDREVREMYRDGCLPGLVEGHSSFITLATAPNGETFVHSLTGLDDLTQRAFVAGFMASGGSEVDALVAFEVWRRENL